MQGPTTEARYSWLLNFLAWKKVKKLKRDATEEKKSIEDYKKDYAEYWKNIIGVDGEFDLKEEKVYEQE